MYRMDVMTTIVTFTNTHLRKEMRPTRSESSVTMIIRSNNNNNTIKSKVTDD